MACVTSSSSHFAVPNAAGASVPADMGDSDDSLKNVLIGASFDSGNIEVVDFTSLDNIQVNIRPDTNATYLQWFHFRTAHAKHKTCTYRILNASKATFAFGWPGTQVCFSYDRESWLRLPTTSYDKETGVLTFSHTSDHDLVYYAFFAPYPLTRYYDVVAKAQSSPLCDLRVLGQTVQGRDLFLLKFAKTGGTEGGGKRRKCWLIARQHAGESMASWFIEATIQRLIDSSDTVSQQLLAAADVYIVPHMNPDGSFAGNLRANAAGVDLNRAWPEPSMENSPEVFLTRQAMEQIGVDLFLDVHGDEHETCTYAIGSDGVAALDGSDHFTPEMEAHEDAFRSNYNLVNPDFDLSFRLFPRRKPCSASVALANAYVASRHGCLSFTLEMPFKDCKAAPDPVYGFSPVRAQRLGHDVLAPILAHVHRLNTPSS